MKQSEKNLGVIENFILHLTTNTYGDVDGNVPFTITANELYKSASEYIEEDHVDGKGNPEDNAWYEVALSYINDGGTESIDYANNCTELKEDSVEFVFIDKWIKDNSDTNITVDNFDAIIFRKENISK